MECPIAKSFWNQFTKWYNATCRGNIALEQNEIIYGVLKFTSSGLTLNHLIIIGKYFLYINAVQDDKRPQFTDFVTLFNEKIELEKYIAITANKLLSFNKSKALVSQLVNADDTSVIEIKTQLQIILYRLNKIILMRRLKSFCLFFYSKFIPTLH